MFLFGPPNIEKLKAKRDVESLIKALSYQKDTNVRRSAVEALGDLKDPRAVAPLISLLMDDELRQTVIESLGKIGTPAVEPLIPLLKDKNADLCASATEALYMIGMPAVNPLIAALEDVYTEAPQFAAEALGKIGDARAVEPLIAALQHYVGRREVVEALGRIGDARAAGPLIAKLDDSSSDVREAATRALEKIGAPAVKLLIGALNVDYSHGRKKTAETLDKLGWQPGKDEAAVAYWIAKQNWTECVRLGTLAVEPLITALKDRDAQVRRFAAEALGKIGDARALAPLIAASRDQEKFIRKVAAAALKNIENTCGVEPFIAALHDTASDVRQTAAETLDRLGWKPAADETGLAYWIAKGNWLECASIGTAAVEPLIAELKSGNPAPAAALEKLGWKPGIDETGMAYWIAKQDWEECVRIGAPAVQSLIAVVQGEKTHLHRGAAEALGRIGDIRALEPLIIALKDRHVREAAIKALGRIGDARAVKPLLAALKGGGSDVHEGVMQVLEQIGTLAVEPLVAALNDTDLYVHQGAAEALGKIGDARAVEPLIASLSDNDERFRDTAITALGKIGDARAVEPLIDALNDNVWFVRKNAADVLGKLGDARAIDPLITMLKDRNPDLRSAAADALDKCGWQAKDGGSAAAFRIAKGDWNECVKIGPPAIQPLISILKDENKYVREGAASALVRLYRGGQLDEPNKALILSHQGEIAIPHEDFFSGCVGFNETHVDRAGVDFPI